MSDPPSPIVHAQELSRCYGQGEAEVRAVDGVSFALPSGSMLALLGRSGSGKSTLLNLIGGVDRATAGELTVAGEKLTGLSEEALALFRRRRLGYVFQAFHLIPSLRVVDNVAVPWMLDGQLTRERSQHIHDLLDRLGLEGLAQRFPDELSGGQQQRVALARAVVHRPALILADEPTGNLDVHSGAAILDLLAELRRDFGISIVMATHAHDAAERCETQLIMEDGHIVETRGTPLPASPPAAANTVTTA